MGMMGEFKVLDPNGHTRTRWNTSNADEVETARRIFDELTGRGYRAFKMNKEGSDGTPKRAFNPRDEETLLVPPIRAG
jgi:hypothetical protein